MELHYDTFVQFVTYMPPNQSWIMIFRIEDILVTETLHGEFVQEWGEREIKTRIIVYPDLLNRDQVRGQN